MACCGSTRDGRSYVSPPCLAPVTDASCAQPGDLVVEPFPVDFEGQEYPHARVAYVVGRPPSPVILVHHNYAGLKQFDVDQACFLAKIGYVGLAVDLYQDVRLQGAPAKRYGFADRSVNSGPMVSLEAFRAEVSKYAVGTPDAVVEATFAQFAEVDSTTGSLAVDWKYVKHRTGSFECMNDLYLHPARWRRLIAQYLEKAFEHPAVASGLSGAIGYCLGGQSCLEQVRAGHPVQAVCSFHGLLNSRPMTPEEPYNALQKITEEQYRRVGVAGYWDVTNAPLNTYTRGCLVLVENGSLDPHVPPESLAEFEAEMAEAGIDWRFDNHGGAEHGFALGPGVVGSRYKEKVDRRSTVAMLNLFAEAWPQFEQHPVASNASGTHLEWRTTTVVVTTRQAACASTAA